ncbi:MFS transporter [Saccharopolyspora rhizosphaerae]|uniref:MFS transporter n=1 Tax=Saccharopolyspora rhizosphaerae TaxID=2492662 RepID=A0A3R8NT70_9PSEU|nr:MFS transporter [Saccharopolyspora rhizosphaerae]RRO12592.1 MFS transporter [Saccharopolyspora rhizosphaerae]
MSAVAPATGRLSRGLLFAAALCAGTTVANIYLAQPIIGPVAETFGVSAQTAGIVVTTAMLGYAAGLLFVIPLGDSLDRRKVVGVLSVLTAALLVGSSLAPSLPVLAVLGGLAAVTTVVPQVLIPLVVQLADPAQRGTAMSWVQAGLITGIMGARVLSGQLAGLLGWRSVFAVAAALTLVVGLWTVRALPSDGRRDSVDYWSLLRSLPGYLRREPGLRRACLRQAGSFAAFNAVWTTLALVLTAPPHSFTVAEAGLVGLLGLLSAVLAPTAGKLVDRRGPRLVGALGLTVLAFAALVLVLGTTSLTALLIGTAAVPIGLQVGQAANQNAALSVNPDAGGRLNTIFMLSTFLAGAIGSAAGSVAYGAYGWPGVCATALVFLGLGAVGLRRVR